MAVTNRIGSCASGMVMPAPPDSKSPSRERGGDADKSPGRCWAIGPTPWMVMDRVIPASAGGFWGFVSGTKVRGRLPSLAASVRRNWLGQPLAAACETASCGPVSVKRWGDRPAPPSRNPPVSVDSRPPRLVFARLPVPERGPACVPHEVVPSAPGSSPRQSSARRPRSPADRASSIRSSRQTCRAPGRRSEASGIAPTPCSPSCGPRRSRSPRRPGRGG